MEPRLPRLVFSPELASIHGRIETLEQFSRNTWLLVVAQASWSAISSECFVRKWIRRS